MREMTYSLFKEHATSWDYGEKYHYLITAIEKFIKIDDDVAFYPKHIFVDNEDLEVYFFEDEKVTIFLNRKESLLIKMLSYNQIESMEMKYKDTYEPAELIIRFDNGEVIELNSKNDTNNTWLNRFTKKIEEIFIKLKS